MSTKDVPFQAVFAPATHEAWRALAERVLKGPSVESLVARTIDGIAVEPLHAKARSPFSPLLRSAAGPWRVVQRMDHPDPGAANQLALQDLRNGATGLVLSLSDAPSAHGFGVAVAGTDDLDRALAGVELGLIHLRLEPGGHGRDAAGWLVELAARRGHALGDLDVDLGLDPLGVLACRGALPVGWDETGSAMADTLGALADRGFRGAAFLADGRPHHEAGASEAQELAAVLATGIAYLRALELNGVPLASARRHLSFLVVADQDEILSLVKMRALRRLWARLEEACGLTPQPIRLYAETSRRMLTRRDPWTNLLRATIATVAAGLGGADAITVLPFTAALGLADGFARRLARNTQLVLLEEAHLWRVGDPAAGSGAFEDLTEALAQRAWGLMQEIEAEGGLVESLWAGAWQKRLAAVRAEREAALAAGRQALVGTTIFPDGVERRVDVLMQAPPQDGRASATGALVVEPLPSRRLAEPFEGERP